MHVTDGPLQSDRNEAEGFYFDSLYMAERRFYFLNYLTICANLEYYGNSWDNKEKELPMDADWMWVCNGQNYGLECGCMCRAISNLKMVILGWTPKLMDNNADVEQRNHKIRGQSETWWTECCQPPSTPECLYNRLQLINSSKFGIWFLIGSSYGGRRSCTSRSHITRTFQ